MVASAYSVLKTKWEWHETKGGVNPTRRWGGFMKVSAYRGIVVVDIAIVQCHCAISYVDSTSELPEQDKHGTSVKSEHPIGAH